MWQFLGPWNSVFHALSQCTYSTVALLDESFTEIGTENTKFVDISGSDDDSQCNNSADNPKNSLFRSARERTRQQNHLLSSDVSVNNGRISATPIGGGSHYDKSTWRPSGAITARPTHSTDWSALHRQASNWDATPKFSGGATTRRILRTHLTENERDRTHNVCHLRKPMNSATHNEVIDEREYTCSESDLSDYEVEEEILRTYTPRQRQLHASLDPQEDITEAPVNAALCVKQHLLNGLNQKEVHYAVQQMFKFFVVEMTRGSYFTQLAAGREYVTLYCQITETLTTLTIDQNSGQRIEFPLSEITKIYSLIKESHPSTNSYPNEHHTVTALNNKTDSLLNHRNHQIPKLNFDCLLPSFDYLVVIQFRIRRLAFVFKDEIEADRFKLCFEILIKYIHQKTEPEINNHSCCKNNKTASSFDHSGFTCSHTSLHCTELQNPICRLTDSVPNNTLKDPVNDTHNLLREPSNKKLSTLICHPSNITASCDHLCYSSLYSKNQLQVNNSNNYQLPDHSNLQQKRMSSVNPHKGYIHSHSTNHDEPSPIVSNNSSENTQTNHQFTICQRSTTHSLNRDSSLSSSRYTHFNPLENELLFPIDSQQNPLYEQHYDSQSFDSNSYTSSSTHQSLSSNLSLQSNLALEEELLNPSSFFKEASLSYPVNPLDYNSGKEQFPLQHNSLNHTHSFKLNTISNDLTTHSLNRSSLYDIEDINRFDTIPINSSINIQVPSQTQIPKESFIKSTHSFSSIEYDQHNSYIKSSSIIDRPITRTTLYDDYTCPNNHIHEWFKDPSSIRLDSRILRDSSTDQSSLKTCSKISSNMSADNEIQSKKLSSSSSINSSYTNIHQREVTSDTDVLLWNVATSFAEDIYEYSM